MSSPMTPEPELCFCGKPLHYSMPELQEAIEQLIVIMGPRVKVTAGGHSWMVPRHYIALHGINAMELPFLGFEEVAND